MAYNKFDKIPFWKRIRHKTWLSFINFPHNSIRCFSLRKCGYNIGKNVYIGHDLIVATTLGSKECKLTLEDRVSIAPRVTLLLSSDANWSELNHIYPPIRGQITIKHDCWLGANVTVLPNITIGEYSIIGAGAVITKNVPPYSVVAGVPGKIIKNIKF